MKNNLAKKFLVYFYGSGIAALIGLIITMLSTRLFSPEEFGKYSMFLLSANLLFLVVMSGTDQAYVRFYYEEKINLRPNLLKNSLIIPLLILSFFSFLILIFSKQLTMFIFEEYNIALALLILLKVWIQVFHKFATLSIRMQQKAKLYSLLEVFNKFINLVLIIIFVWLISNSFMSLIYAFILAQVIVVIVAISKERNSWSFISKWKEKEKGKRSVYEIIRYSYPFVLTSSIIWLFQSIDKIALKIWSNFEQIGIYEGAFRIVALLSIIQAAFSTFWTPVVFQHFQEKPNDKEFIRRAANIVLLIMSAIAILLILFKDIISLILGSEYREAASIMAFLIFMPIMYTVSETTVNGINFYNKTKWHILIALVSCLLNLIGNVYLVPKYEAIGAAISTGISYIAFFYLRTFISNRYYKVNYDFGKIGIVIILLVLNSTLTLLDIKRTLEILFSLTIGIIIIFLYSKEIKYLYQKLGWSSK